MYKSKDTEAFVEDALEWIKSYNEPNDFMENLRVICSGSHTTKGLYENSQSVLYEL